MAVRVEGIEEYKLTHGRKTRGYGMWKFEINGKKYDCAGTFTHARKVACQFAKNRNIGIIKVLA